MAKYEATITFDVTDFHGNGAEMPASDIEEFLESDCGNLTDSKVPEGARYMANVEASVKEVK